MVRNSKSTGRALSMPAALAIGALVSLIITVLAAALLAKLVDTERLQWNNIGYGIMLLILMASFFGAVIACEKVKRQRLVISFLSGIVYFGILLSITALFFGGQYEAVGVTALLVLGGSGCAGLLGIREKRGGNPRQKRRHYR